MCRRLRSQLNGHKSKRRRDKNTTDLVRVGGGRCQEAGFVRQDNKRV